MTSNDFMGWVHAFCAIALLALGLWLVIAQPTSTSIGAGAFVLCYVPVNMGVAIAFWTGRAY